MTTERGSPKTISKMEREGEDCPVVAKEVMAFLVCFACPSFLRRVSGVWTALEDRPPEEWPLR